MEPVVFRAALAEHQPVAVVAGGDPRLEQGAQPGQAGPVADQQHRAVVGRDAEARIGAYPQVDRLADPDAARVPMVAVTFDDGTADVTDLAVPVLVEHGVPATLYVATDYVDRGLEFPNGGTPTSWSALRDAASTGCVTIGSHTHSHALLDRLAADAVADELDRSIDLIGEHVGAIPEDFAYPKAVRGSREAAATVRARFRSAALAGTRVNRYGATDPYALARSPVQVSDGMRWFRHKVAGGLGFEDTLRGAADRVRYARVTT
jgi:peptidoglycan/xylan/chitin deacetylase (PgdA/CDA1 family)